MKNFVDMRAKRAEKFWFMLLRSAQNGLKRDPIISYYPTTGFSKEILWNSKIGRSEKHSPLPTLELPPHYM